jgi:hypothetical protein
MNDNEMAFEFRGINFKGLRFKRSNKYSEKFFKKLIEDGTHYSEMIYVDAVHEELEEEMHIKISFSFITKVLSILTMIATIFLGFVVHFYIPALVVLTTGFGFERLSKFFIIRADEHFAGRKVSEELVKVIFNK